MSKESRQHRTDQYAPIKAKTPPRRPAPKLSPGQSPKSSTSHRRGQDR